MRPDSTLCALLLACCAVGCGSESSKSSDGEPTSGTSETGDAGQATFRVVFIADTHVIGPQYTCCSESEWLDNDSIMKTADRLAQVRDAVNALDPQPDLVFVLGDVMHDSHVFETTDEYVAEESGWSISADLFDGFDAPVHLVWGNHDYEVSCDTDRHQFSHAFTHDLFDRFFATAPTDVVDHKGWRFILANSQLGPTWTPGDPMCNTGLASYGREQLGWMDDLLADGLPSIVMAHYYMAVTETNEDPDGPFSGLGTVLDAHSNMKLFLSGHMHRWVDGREDGVFPQVILGATRYDTDNFWLFEFEENGDTYSIIDETKPRWFTTCADTWTYGDPPALDSAAAEQGDCSG